MNLDVTKIVLDKVTAELQEILDSDPTTYGKYNIVITNELQFVKRKDVKPNTIFFVIKFLQGNKDFNQQVQPFTLNALSEHDSLDICQKLMMDFSETYNLKYDFSNSNYTLRQTLSTVAVLNNFNEAYDGFRSVLYLSGTFYFGINSNPIISIIVDDSNHSFDSVETDYTSFTTTTDYVGYYVYQVSGVTASKVLVTNTNKDNLGITPGTTVAYIDSWFGEKIDFISSQMSYDAQQDSQPFFGTNNFNKTVATIGTLSLGFTMYSVKTNFYNNVFDMAFNYGGTVDINKTFKISVSFKNGKTYTTDMKLISISNVQELRDFPATSFTFVR